MARVFIAERNPRYDIRAATRYGDVVAITEDRLNPFNTVDFVEQVRNGLSNFDPDRDYFCMTGQSLTISMALSVLIEMYGHARLLLFDARNSTYSERVFDPGKVSA